MSEKNFDIEVNAAEIAEEITEAARQSLTEEDLRIRTTNILRTKVLERLGVPWARFEYTLVSGVRPDALYGHVILEYENPGTFKTRSGFEKAVEQVKKYITDKARFESEYKRYFGVVLDGYKIGFVRYIHRLKGWDIKGPIEVNRYTALKLLEAIRGLVRRPLDATLLIKDLGPESRVARDTVSIFYQRVKDARMERTNMLFSDWKRVFSQVCAYSPKRIKGLEKVYRIQEKDLDYEALLFAIHTYYALVMKILAAEVAVLYGGYFLQSYTRKLEGAYLKSPESLKVELQNLEEGGVFINLGIANFLEADYFAWYLDEWNAELANAVIRIIQRIAEYEPGTAELEPHVVQDLFKKLYQNLVPRKIRHDLGEYYTPDWLAELVLDEIGFNLERFEKIAEKKGLKVPLELRLLDPACGSGTFLVLCIKRVKDYAKEHFLEEEALGYIKRNIVGFDLNPLAVMASRANYLLALGELIRTAVEPIELPVYFADSILAEKRSTLAGTGMAMDYVLTTTAGEFSIPVSVAEKGLLNIVLSLTEECIRLGYTPQQFKSRLLREARSLEENELLQLIELFRQLLKLEKEEKNGIWTRILNSFAPLFAGKFDYVIGNPPWVNWENLPNGYRNSLFRLLNKYGLFKPGERWGGGKIDISTLFVYVGVDRYLNKNGKLGFVITQTLFKSRGARERFRKFRFGSIEHFKIQKVHDLVELKPFEGASNRTSVFTCRKGEVTEYPIPYILWRKKEGTSIDAGLTLEEVYDRTLRINLVAKPINDEVFTSPWITVPPKVSKVMSKISRKSDYTAKPGVCTWVNGVYWVRIIEKALDNFVFVENLADIGRKEIRKTVAKVESDFLYPLLRGRDVNRWESEPSAWIILAQNPNKLGKAYDEGQLKVKYPKTYGYFKLFETELRQRSGYKKYFEPVSGPFYSVYNIGSYTFAPYKVVWREQARGLTATVLETINDPYLGRRIIVPDHKLMLIPCSCKEEAHYICAVLNSIVARFVARSYTIQTQISTHILKHINVSRFDPKNDIHNKLSDLSTLAHRLTAEGKEDELSKTEKEIDNLVAELWSLNQENLKEIKRSLKILEG